MAQWTADKQDHPTPAAHRGPGVEWSAWSSGIAAARTASPARRGDLRRGRRRGGVDSESL